MLSLENGQYKCEFFCLPFRIGMNGFPSKRTIPKIDLLLDQKVLLFCRLVLALFSPEILHAVAVKGLWSSMPRMSYYSE